VLQVLHLVHWLPLTISEQYHQVLLIDSCRGTVVSDHLSSGTGELFPLPLLCHLRCKDAPPPDHITALLDRYGSQTASHAAQKCSLCRKTDVWFAFDHGCCLAAQRLAHPTTQSAAALWVVGCSHLLAKFFDLQNTIASGRVRCNWKVASYVNTNKW